MSCWAVPWLLFNRWLISIQVKDAQSSPASTRQVKLQPGVRPAIVHPTAPKDAVSPRTIRRWNTEAKKSLRDCYNTTDWNVVLGEPGEDIDGMTHIWRRPFSICYTERILTRRVARWGSSTRVSQVPLKPSSLVPYRRNTFECGLTIPNNCVTDRPQDSTSDTDLISRTGDPQGIVFFIIWGYYCSKTIWKPC